MHRSTNIRRGVATGIAGAGLALGGLGIASAEDGAQSDSSTAAASSARDTDSAERSERDGGHGPGLGHGPGGSELAEALGVSETELQSALESVREQLEPSQVDRSTPPADGEFEERRGQMIDALAELYDLLGVAAPGPMVTLNRIVAVAMVHGAQDALRQLDAASSDDALAGHHRVDAVRAHLLDMVSDRETARHAYLQAAERTLSVPKQRYRKSRGEALGTPQQTRSGDAT